MIVANEHGEYNDRVKWNTVLYVTVFFKTEDEFKNWLTDGAVKELLR